MNVGSLAIGQSITKTFSIRNSGKGSLVGSLQVLIDPPTRGSVFTVTPDSFNIAPGQSQAENVTFTPDAPVDAALAIISSNDATRPTIGVVLNGSGLSGKLSAPNTITITTATGTATQANLSIKNVGKGVLSGNWATVAISPYSVTSGPFALTPGSSIAIPITFHPTVKGTAPSVALAIQVVGPSTGGKVVTLKGVGK
jgi:hypothetical protein